MFVARGTRWVSLVEQELLTLPEHMSSPPIFSGVRVTRWFRLTNVLSVLLRFTDLIIPFVSSYSS